MVKILKALALVSLVTFIGLVSNGCKNPISIVLYAQSFPTVIHGTWSPNATTENIVSYKVLVNGTVVSTFPAASCTTICISPITIPAAGNYTFSTIASNQRLSTDPSTLQDGPATTPPVSFSLNLIPSKTSNNTVGQ